MGFSAGRPCGAGRGAGRTRRPAKWGGGGGVFQRGQRGAELFAGPAGAQGFSGFPVFRPAGYISFGRSTTRLFRAAPLPVLLGFQLAIIQRVASFSETDTFRIFDDEISTGLLIQERQQLQK